MESKAFHRAHLDTVPLNSLKPYWGHTLGASGIIESIVCLEQLRCGEVWGTKGYETCGVPYPLSIHSETVTVPMRACVKTASGFGGCNAAIVLALAKKQTDGAREKEIKKEAESVAEPVSTEKGKEYITRRVKIRENRILLNERVFFEGNPADDFPSFIRNAYKSLDLDDRKFYKMDDLCKLGYIAAGYGFEASANYRNGGRPRSQSGRICLYVAECRDGRNLHPVQDTRRKYFLYQSAIPHSFYPPVCGDRNGETKIKSLPYRLVRISGRAI